MYLKASALGVPFDVDPATSEPILNNGFASNGS